MGEALDIVCPRSPSVSGGTAPSAPAAYGNSGPSRAELLHLQFNSGVTVWTLLHRRLYGMTAYQRPLRSQLTYISGRWPA